MFAEGLFHRLTRLRRHRPTGRALDRRLVLAVLDVLPHVPGDEHAQQIAGHASPKTTKLYDRTADTVTGDEIERIVI